MEEQMADILKISTPLVDRNNIVHANKQTPEPGVPFQLADTTRVAKSNPQSELLQQNNGMPTREEAPAILTSLLRDPAVTVNFLKNIYLLQEIINLIPAGNTALTGEINQLFRELMVAPQEIAGELARQEEGSTLFRGALFDLLRNLVEQQGKPEQRAAVTNLLKSLNAMLSKGDILHSVSNNLEFLADNLQPAKGLHERLIQLAESFRQPDAPQQFESLKSQTLGLLQQVESSILYSPKLQQVLPLITYNLSRFSGNPDYMQDTVNSLLGMMDDKEQRGQLIEQLRTFLESIPLRRGEDGRIENPGKQNSKVMDALVRLIKQESASEELTLASAEKLDKIIQSLLSSPCNFTPLLHFVIPVEDMGQRSFAEIWIEHSEEQRQGQKGSEESIHLLLAFNVESVGQFEAELFVTGKKLGLNLLCPSDYLEDFAGLRDFASRVTAGTSYELKEIFIGKLERPRSLMEVFKTLPHKRTGIDVKI
ncbi:MAG: antitoxin [Angelakisella sp.]